MESSSPFSSLRQLFTTRHHHHLPHNPILYHNAASIVAGGIFRCDGIYASVRSVFNGLKLFQPASNRILVLHFFRHHLLLLMLLLVDLDSVLLQLLSATTPGAFLPLHIAAAAADLIHSLAQSTEHNTSTVFVGGFLNVTFCCVGSKTSHDARMDQGKGSAALLAGSR
ncbi:uncharacterized protein SPSK_06694 [Sporothrix schenckii 1099-18]|uniref:Uncharacterized protein n=1 Tax=Sporothrix schenckii 1099-18 TaxID=1397361 RepID=A0A0F2MJ15_SPOSC|nr:uncharacterized protein SPSK_06694 [Sporothrix schenckii 1099-18]KJR89693.1 hypothetical protein SPSK_06694 [Sporothrix schenckii 1099-18]